MLPPICPEQSKYSRNHKLKQPGHGHKRKEMPDMVNKTLTDDEKALLQAKHRLEAAEARERVKERKTSTRRLIQEGAILESVAPGVCSMDLEELKHELSLRLKGM